MRQCCFGAVVCSDVTAHDLKNKSQSVPESYDLAVKNVLPTLSVSEHSGTFYLQKATKKKSSHCCKILLNEEFDNVNVRA